ncbi:hypothetical protein LguiB_007066 [Lonicera macranthoides]
MKLEQAASYYAAVLLKRRIASGNPIITGNSREALEIIIGAGGYSPSPPPPPEYQDCPPPPPPPCGFESARIAQVHPIIQAFKENIDDDPYNVTDTWEGNDICNKYKGFSCDTFPNSTDKTVSGVKFNGFNFGGKTLTLDGFLDKLPDIAFFHANSNNFIGTIPQKVANLKFLYELDLSNNKFTGNFPTELLSATQLTILDLRYNQLSGYVPPEIFKLDLDLFFINNNNLVQCLPENLGSTPVLYLTLANNKFTGPIPKSIGQASGTLVEVLLLNNQLTGCLPYEIGLLQKATVFDVGQNQLTGPIPHSFGCLAKMEFLNLAQNMFYGPVPEAVCELPNLVNFTVSYNYFTQVGPVCRELIKKKKLDVRMNCILDLPMQRSAAECAAFFSKPKYCADAWSFNLMPCEKYGRSNSSERKLTAKATPRRSYAALLPH